MKLQSALLFIPPVDRLLTDAGLSWVVTLLEIVAVFALARLGVALCRRICRGVARLRSKALGEAQAKRLETALSVVNGAVKYLLYFIAGAIALGRLGMQEAMTSLLTAAGIGALAVGIGAQSLIGDVVTGLFMIFEDQLSVGDYVEIGNVSGTVESVTLRTTTVRGYRGELNILPNSQIKQIANYSRTDYLAIADMELPYAADLDRAMRLMLEEAQSYAKELGERVTQPPEALGVSELTPDSARLRLAMRVRALQHWEVQRELTRRLRARLLREGFAPPTRRLAVEEYDRKV